VKREVYGSLLERERERENMEGASGSGTSCMMGFGDNNMMVPLMNSGVDEANDKPFLPLPLISNNSYGQRLVSALMPEQDIIDNRMETNNNSCMRAKIMAHPLFPRLLAAYVNCQKVINFQLLLKFKNSFSFSLSISLAIRGPFHGTQEQVFVFEFFFFK
jgi:hypothetical protein